MRILRNIVNRDDINKKIISPVNTKNIMKSVIKYGKEVLSGLTKLQESEVTTHTVRNKDLSGFTDSKNSIQIIIPAIEQAGGGVKLNYKKWAATVILEIDRNLNSFTVYAAGEDRIYSKCVIVTLDTEKPNTYTKQDIDFEEYANLVAYLESVYGVSTELIDELIYIYNIAK